MLIIERIGFPASSLERRVTKCAGRKPPCTCSSFRTCNRVRKTNIKRSTTKTTEVLSTSPIVWIQSTRGNWHHQQCLMSEPCRWVHLQKHVNGSLPLRINGTQHSCLCSCASSCATNNYIMCTDSKTTLKDCASNVRCW